MRMESEVRVIVCLFCFVRRSEEWQQEGLSKYNYLL